MKVRLAYDCFPQDLAEHDKIAFDDRYHNIGPWRDACLPIGMLGPAAFHQMLSNALLNIRCRRPICDPSDNYESIRHHGIAVRIVKEGMSDPAVATSDAFIGAIVGLTCYHVRIRSCRNM